MYIRLCEYTNVLIRLLEQVKNPEACRFGYRLKYLSEGILIVGYLFNLIM